MHEIIRTKERRYADDYSSDDERSSSYGRSRTSGGGGYKTVKTYRVTSGRKLEEADDDYRSLRSERLDIGTRHHHLEVDRRVERADPIERPRSALEYRDPERARETSRTVVYERERERPRERSPQPLSARELERERERERDRQWERERETDVRVERRVREREEEPREVERYSRETEYYTRPDTIVIRERAPEPPKFVESAPVQKGYEVIRREEIIDSREVAPRRQEEEYAYRRDVREVEPRGAEVARYERREIRRRGSISDDDYNSDGSDVAVRVKRKVFRSGSHGPRHKLHVVGGALAGAGAATLIADHMEKTGGSSEHRGKKVAGGALLGVLGTEVLSRVRSRHRERSRNRSRSSSRGGNHTKLKTGLALAATAIAAAAAGKYISNRNEKKEEMERGRSRTRSVSRRRRFSSDDDGAPSKHNDAKHRATKIATAGASAAALAGVVEHLRNKSRGRSRSKSKNRLRTGGVVAATGLAGAAVAGMIEARKAKHEAAGEADRKADREAAREAARKKRHRSGSRARSRSLAYSDSDVDPEMGMVEYGNDPFYAQQTNTYNYDPAAAAAAAERSRERRSSRSRSRSRVRNIAGGAIAAGAAGAAAVGINQYHKRKERKEAERERRRHEEEMPPERYSPNESYDDEYSPSVPRPSAGAFFPEPNPVPPPPVPPAGYTQHTTMRENEFAPHPPYDPAHHPPYNPGEFAGQPPVDPFVYPAPRDAREGGNVSSTPPLVPLAPTPPPRNMYNIKDEEGSLVSPLSTRPSSGLVSPTQEPPPSKSVAFAPLSPASTHRLAQTRRRRNSDPSSDRPNVPSKHRRRHQKGSRSPSPASSDDVELLPDRFDKDGHPLDGSRNVYGKEGEMVERIVHDFEDVIEGRQSWRSLLRGFFVEADGRRR